MPPPPITGITCGPEWQQPATALVTTHRRAFDTFDVIVIAFASFLLGILADALFVSYIISLPTVTNPALMSTESRPRLLDSIVGITPTRIRTLDDAFDEANPPVTTVTTVPQVNTAATPSPPPAHRIAIIRVSRCHAIGGYRAHSGSDSADGHSQAEAIGALIQKLLQTGPALIQLV